MSTPVDKFIADLDGGQFEEKLSKVISIVAGAVMDHESGGEITIKLTVKPLSPQQVMVKHDLKFTRPTLRGKQQENETMSTPMYVGEKGKLTFFPENQGQFFGKTGHVIDN
ncbi:hypothetical protein [Rheinheimera sp. MMS21-TC3]|uniref:hypothetical protein n=1 Tax=Rheinheimera sp. MMS21-TC3 TaxID=3072790 RepID=UPI0028C4DCD4|nr:hypothetical protein [Rheinheimera sp. MMS21-TC3]WNO60409.1 hypothetical protein RDV63_05440 [Rheinheimera sp. MMS21-TC3]